MTRRRRVSRLAVLVGLAVVALAALVIRRGDAESRAPAELPVSQWQRLTRRIATAAEERRQSRTVPVAAPGRETAMPGPEFPASIPWELRSRGGLERAVLARQATEYGARRPKSVVELQQFRRTYTARIAGAGGRSGQAVLINLSPRVNFWYLLQLTWNGGGTASYHLTNSRPETHDLILDGAFPGGLLLEGALGRTECDLWSSDAPSSLAAASRLSTPYVTLCDDEVVLRRPTAGRRTRLEWATDFLRDEVWGGEGLTVLVRDSLFQDAHLVKGVRIAGAAEPRAAAAAPGLPVP
ncbi:MAG: hypothetical protein F9K16_05765, partial [Thermoanaerobaculia bacterium]